jgi:eukaryotic-like serine/threonine-protein kinase
MIGSTLSHYRILEKLGAGGMGEVYLAEDTRLRRRLALKVLRPSLTSDPQFLQRFEREAEAIAALNHPNIVTIYSIEEIEGVRCLTMELVEGETLAERMARGALPTKEILDVAIPLADCLAAAHERGIVHRDLKPSNIMINREGRTKVLDFGLAKVLDTRSDSAGPYPSGALTHAPLTGTGTILGTVEYMAPEQLRGGVADRRSDIFSLGIILYEMSTGLRPFRGSGVAEQISAVLRDEPSPVLSLTPDLSSDLARLITRCLEKDPEKRLQSAKDLRNELQAVQSDLASASWRRSTATVELPRPSPARPRRAVLFAGAGALIAVALWAGLTLARRGREASPGGVATDASVAVLPLANFSGDPEYFVDGMTDALIFALGNIGSLRVISRQSVMGYKASRKTIPEIARELNVDMFVEGSVLRAGQRVRITAQLIRASPEKQLWSQSYERDFRDVLSLQSEIALAIANEIRVRITPQEKARLADVKPVDPAAHEAYLKGRYYWNLRSAEGTQKAIASFEQAIAIDPAHAPSYAGLADTYAILGYQSPRPDEMFAKAEAAAGRALALDNQLAQAHASLGVVRFFHDWDWKGAEKEFRLALAGNPNYATAHQWYWAYLEAMGRRKEALDAILRARQLDPLSPIIGLDTAVHYSFSRDHDRAIEECRKTLELNPRFGPAEVWLWVAYDHKGMKKEALQHYLQSMRLSGNAASADAVEAVYAKSGYAAAMRTAAEEQTRLSKTRSVDTNQIAWLWVAAGEKEEALRWLEQAAERRAAVLVWLNVAGEWDSLRDDPRFQALLGRMRFPA